MSTHRLSSTLSTYATRIVRIVAFVALGLGVATSAVAQESGGSESKADADREAEASQTDPEKRAIRLLNAAQHNYHEGKWYRARKLYEKSHELAPEGTSVRVHAALGRSTLLWEQGNYASARRLIDRAMKLAKKQNLDSAIGRLLLTLGHIEASRGQLGSAEGTLRHCVRLAAEQNDPVFGPICKLNYRMVRKLQGKRVASKASYRKALEKLESVDSPLTVGLSLAKTAELYADGGQSGRAFELLNRAGKEYEKAGSIPAQARNRMLKARMLQNTGRWKRARSYLEGLIETFQQLGSKPALVEALGLLGNDAQHRRAWDEAEGYYGRALELARSIGSPQKVAKVEVALCELGGKRGSFESSASHCRSAIESFRELGMWKLVAAAQSSLGGAAQMAGNLETARKALLSAVKTREERIHPRLRTGGQLGRDRVNLCQVEMRMQIEGALYRCRKALEGLDEKRHSQAMFAATHYARGNAASHEGHPDEAARQLGKAADLYRNSSPPNYRRYADAKLRQGAVLKRNGETESAREAFRAGLEQLENGNAELPRLSIKLRIQYAQILLGEENWKRAADELERLAEACRTAGDSGNEAWAYSALARAQKHMGEHDAARESLERALPLARKAGDDALVETVESNLETLSSD